MSLVFSFEKIEIDNTDCFDCKGKLYFPLLEKELKFPYPIYGIVEFEKTYVIRIYPRTEDIYNENIFGIDKETSAILWQIEPVMRPDVNSPFTGLWKEGDKAGIYNWGGMEYIIIPETGEILSSLFTK